MNHTMDIDDDDQQPLIDIDSATANGEVSALLVAPQMKRLELNDLRSWPTNYTDCSLLPQKPANGSREMQCVRFGYFRHAQGIYNGEMLRFCQCLVPGCTDPPLRSLKNNKLVLHLLSTHDTYYKEFKTLCSLNDITPTAPANHSRKRRAPQATATAFDPADRSELPTTRMSIAVRRKLFAVTLDQISIRRCEDIRRHFLTVTVRTSRTNNRAQTSVTRLFAGMRYTVLVLQHRIQTLIRIHLSHSLTFLVQF